MIFTISLSGGVDHVIQIASVTSMFSVQFKLATQMVVSGTHAPLLLHTRCKNAPH